MKSQHDYKIPAMAFSAWSGTGKTTLIEKLVPELKKKGLRVAVIKHDAHAFEIDREGKDSWRFQKAGADVTVISSTEKTAIVEQRPLELSQVLSCIRDVDLVLVEGYNTESLPRIGISRKATGKGFRLPVSEYAALVTDESPVQPDLTVPVFSPDAIAEIAGFILDYFGLAISS